MDTFTTPLPYFTAVTGRAKGIDFEPVQAV